MRVPRLMSWGCLAFGLAGIALASPTAAQGPALRGSTPRTPDGHPDLQGVYNIATITPLERPAEFGTRMNLTPQEAASLERAEAVRDEKLNAPTTNADQRSAPPVGGDPHNPNATYLERLFEGGGGVVGGYNNF